MSTDGIKFYYGYSDKYINISRTVFEKCFFNGKIIIPADDHQRNTIFGDPFFGIVKHIKVNNIIYEIGQSISIDYYFEKGLKFYYGSNDKYINISKTVFKKCFSNGKIIITADDHQRNLIFGDPFEGTIKHIKVVDEKGASTIYEIGQIISIDGIPDFKNELSFIKESEPGSKICIYSGIFGNYDVFTRHVKQTIPCDFIYFYDSDTKIGDCVEKPCKTSSIPDELSPVLTSAWMRTYPFKIDVLDSYDIIIYIDGNQTINDSKFLEDMVIPHTMKPWDLMVPRHNFKKCAYDEANFSMTIAKYNNTNLKYQISHYKEDGFPENNGLYWNGLLVYNRKSDLEKMKSFQDLYWHEFHSNVINPNLPFHPQGQVSLPYCLWKKPIDLIVLPPLDRTTKYIKYSYHLR